MRLYIPVSLEDLRQWSAGDSVTREGYNAASEAEEDELAALESAAEEGQAVAVAVVGSPTSAVQVDDVVALHVDADSSGHLAWYDPSELSTVIAILSAT